MHIFLIRHGQSITNTGENFVKRIPDHLVSLSDLGKQQAYDAGVWLKQYCDEKQIDLSRARLWRSPYLRTRQTSEEINKSLHITDIKEDITLTEQRFGLFDAVPETAWSDLHPDEYEEYIRQISNQGKFYAKMPQGESPFDVAIRIHQFMGTIARDYERHGIDTLFVVSHGTAIRAFLLRWFHYSPEWYQAERNPQNCYIREIIDDVDLGYINAKG